MLHGCHYLRLIAGVCGHDCYYCSSSRDLVVGSRTDPIAIMKDLTVTSAMLMV